MDLDTMMTIYRGPLIGMIAAWGAPWSDAVEIAQDSFTTAWLSRDSCRGDLSQPEVFGGWLRGVALNRYRSWARSRWRQRLRFVPLTPGMNEPIATTSTAHSDHLEELRNAISRLPTKQREVVLMHYLEETSVKEVASLLSVSAKTVEGRLYQARRNLRRMLEGTRSNSSIARLLLCLSL